MNVGQLVRERYGQDDAVLIGFSTYSGTVTAATEWGGPAECKYVQPALPDSYEALFHELDLEHFLVVLHDGGTIASLRHPRLDRAIGVIYRPETERLSHYFSAFLPEQFDAVLHCDETRAGEPLERTVAWERGAAPETFSSGLCYGGRLWHSKRINRNGTLTQRRSRARVSARRIAGLFLWYRNITLRGCTMIFVWRRMACSRAGQCPSNRA